MKKSFLKRPWVIAGIVGGTLAVICWFIFTYYMLTFAALEEIITVANLPIDPSYADDRAQFIDSEEIWNGTWYETIKIKDLMAMNVTSHRVEKENERLERRTKRRIVKITPNQIVWQCHIRVRVYDGSDDQKLIQEFEGDRTVYFQFEHFKWQVQKVEVN